MKQKLFNWIHRVLRKWGVKSTEFVNLNDLFEEAQKIAPTGVHLSAMASIDLYSVSDKSEFKFTIYTELAGHRSAKNPQEALESFRRFYLTYNSGSTPVKEVNV